MNFEKKMSKKVENFQKTREKLPNVQGPEAIDPERLKTFEYEYPGKPIELDISTEEFTCVCPWSGLPDFAKLTIRYVPDKKCIELKSLKYYLLSYRQVGIVHEHVINRILEDLVVCCDPIRMSVIGEFNIRGGIKTVAKANYEKKVEEAKSGKKVAGENKRGGSQALRRG